MQDAFIGARDVDIGVGNVVACVCWLSIFCMRCVSMRGLVVSMCLHCAIDAGPSCNVGSDIAEHNYEHEFGKRGCAMCRVLAHFWWS